MPDPARPETTEKNKKRWIWRGVLSGFTLLMIVAVATTLPSLGLERLPETLTRFDWRWVAIGFGACLLQILLQVVRLVVIFPWRNLPPLVRIAHAQVVGQFLNSVAPMRTGDAYKVVALSRIDRPGALKVGEATSYILSERLGDNLALLLVAGWASSSLLIGSLVSIAEKVAGTREGILAFLGVSAGLALGAWSFRDRLRRGLERGRAFFQHLRHQLFSRRFVLCVAIAFGTWLVEALSMGLLARGIGVVLTLREMVAAIFIMNLGLALPVTVANVGVFEAGLAFGLSRFGVDPVVGLAVGSLHHINQIVALGLSSLGVWWVEGPRFARFFLWLMGWKIEGELAPVEKAVVIAAPHTSNWDLVYALACASVLGLRIRWVGKHTLFTVPLWGAFLRRLGGIPVDRRSPKGAVGSIAALFEREGPLWLLVPPEGTRSKSEGWKTGFYWIAHQARVPIVLGYLDYGRKRAGVSRTLVPTGDIESDFSTLREYYRDFQGKFPDLQGEVRIRPGSTLPKEYSASPGRS